MTNGDRIRKMSDEELAIICEDGCPPNCDCTDYHCADGTKESCIRCWLCWLREEVNDG